MNLNLLQSFLRRLLANRVYETKCGSIRIKQKGGIAYLTRFIQRPNPEDAFLDSLDLKGKTVYDIGGYVGLMSVLFAKAAGPTGRVIVFEPNQENCARILEHVRLNEVDNVRLLKLGIGSAKSGEQVLIVRQRSGATGSLDGSIQAQIIAEGNYKEVHIEVDTLDGAIAAHDLPKPDFIKMDIEGLEYQALLGMPQTLRDYSPQLWIEIHGADDMSKRENISSIVKLLQSAGYSIWHFETQQSVNSSNCAVAKSGHILCKRS